VSEQRGVSTAAAAIGALAALVLAAVLLRVSSAFVADQPWVGGLFALCGLLLFLVGTDLWSPVRRAGMWALGAGTALAAVAVYVVSALVGLPEGTERESWWNTWLLAGVLAAGVYLLAMAWWFSAAAPTRHRPPRHARVTGVRH
jgi:hypothetical protein